jgi:sarcosine oxidase, subunit gamma
VADHRLKPLLPLGGDAPRVDTFDGFVLSENAGLALASLACRQAREADFAKAAQTLLGIAMPAPGKFVTAPPFGIFWIGPGQWFVEAPLATHEDIARFLTSGVRGLASVAEQTDGWARFDAEGARIADVFERLCPLDVRRMQAGDATRTMIEHLGCIVICRDATRRISVLGPRSAAGSLHHALVSAAKSAL